MDGSFSEGDYVGDLAKSGIEDASKGTADSTDELKPMNLTHPQFNYLPDAPDTITVPSFESPSPYHSAAKDMDDENRAQENIRAAANKAVRALSKYNPPNTLDYSVASLAAIDKTMKNYAALVQFQDPEDIKDRVEMWGAYLGKVIEKAAPEGSTKWHLAPPGEFEFSALRINRGDTIVETNPFAAVTKTLVEMMDPDGNPIDHSVAKYANILLNVKP
jgi:hypothetical protein